MIKFEQKKFGSYWLVKIWAKKRFDYHRLLKMEKSFGCLLVDKMYQILEKK